MGDVTELRGLGDIRTALSTRLHSKPAQKGTAHRDLYILGNEKRRLEKEQVRLARQQRRSQAHLTEIRQATATLKQETERERSSEDPSADIGAGEKQPSSVSEYGRRRWKKMTVDY